MKVYTGGGDKGQTSLFSGERVAKHNVRIDAYGDLDELSSLLGAIAALLPPGEAELGQDLITAQRHLFSAGAWLATTPGATVEKHLQPFAEVEAKELESRIDALSAQLPELRTFIVPGGAPAAAWAHVGRTVCRRAERCILRLADEEQVEVDPQVLAYINRLSDYFFVLSRKLNHDQTIPDAVWRRKHT